ncbi:hypothetical protein [Burkholderia lata]|uniref:hypothetical protein n=1 Tax=Burkholderia lata (strain ATCC 17760 / DSM 23089 / LMG 22485 / NCIMB 9086 / R18194 / 383) TaxID=482957 RepID=UPI0003065509|nr:hypothetical protein [Burkholderia lata]
MIDFIRNRETRCSSCIRCNPAGDGRGSRVGGRRLRARMTRQLAPDAMLRVIDGPWFGAGEAK